VHSVRVGPPTDGGVVEAEPTTLRGKPGRLAPSASRCALTTSLGPGPTRPLLGSTATEFSFHHAVLRGQGPGAGGLDIGHHLGVSVAELLGGHVLDVHQFPGLCVCLTLVGQWGYGNTEN